jgi:nucleolin
LGLYKHFTSKGYKL